MSWASNAAFSSPEDRIPRNVKTMKLTTMILLTAALGLTIANQAYPYKSFSVVQVHKSYKAESGQTSAARALCHTVFPANALSSNAGYE
jgi:hypothetical protein